MDYASPDRNVAISLYVLTSRVDDQAPDSDVFVTQADACAAEGRMARQHIATYRSDYRHMLTDAGWSRAPALEDLSDAECVELANAWDGAVFETTINPTALTLPVSRLQFL